jgi:2-dehydropantoate 2-reductase
MAPTFAFIGAGAVGGYYGALLARHGVDVRFIARGAHLEAIRSHGLRIASPFGDFTVTTRAESDPARIGPVDVVVHTVKTYDNMTAIPLIRPLLGPSTLVLTLQNGVDSAEEIAAVIGEAATVAGATYVATAIEAPGVIRQTGTHRRIVFGEYYSASTQITPRVQALADVLSEAGVQAEPVPDVRPALWEKFAYLAPFAAFTGAARMPIGPIWSDKDTRGLFLDAIDEVAAVARADGVVLPAGYRQRIVEYTGGLPPSTRSSMLIDLQIGKRTEVEALQGSVVRRGRRTGVPTPIMAALYAVLKPHGGGATVSPEA